MGLLTGVLSGGLGEKVKEGGTVSGREASSRERDEESGLPACQSWQLSGSFDFEPRWSLLLLRLFCL